MDTPLASIVPIVRVNLATATLRIKMPNIGALRAALSTRPLPFSVLYHFLKLKIPFFVIHGDYDKTFPFTDMQELVNSLKNNGSDIQLFVMEGYGHDAGCDYDYSLVQASDWLLNEVWK